MYEINKINCRQTKTDCKTVIKYNTTFLEHNLLHNSDKLIQTGLNKFKQIQNHDENVQGISANVNVYYIGVQ